MHTISMLRLKYKNKLPITRIKVSTLRTFSRLKLSAAVTPKKRPINDPIERVLRYNPKSMLLSQQKGPNSIAIVLRTFLSGILSNYDQLKCSHTQDQQSVVLISNAQQSNWGFMNKKGREEKQILKMKLAYRNKPMRIY